MDYHTVLEAFNEDKLIRRDRSLTSLSRESRLNSINLTFLQKTFRNYSVREEPSGATYLLRNIDLDRNHVSLPSWNSGQAWRSRLHLDMILLLVNRKHSPGLTMQNELCPASASPGDKILIKTADTSLTKEVEYSILLNVGYD